MDAADLARRIHDNLTWSRVVGPPLPPVGKANLAAEVEALGGEPDERFVVSLYLLLLGRLPDPNGLAEWLSALKAGISRAVVVRSLTLSAEARSCGTDVSWLPRLLGDESEFFWQEVKALWDRPDDAFMQGLFFLLLGRPGDPPSVGAYCAALAQGMPRAAVVRDVACSREARSRGADVSWLPRLRTLAPPPGAAPRPLWFRAMRAALRRITSIRPARLWPRGGRRERAE